MDHIFSVLDGYSRLYVNTNRLLTFIFSKDGYKNMAISYIFTKNIVLLHYKLEYEHLKGIFMVLHNVEVYPRDA